MSDAESINTSRTIPKSRIKKIKKGKSGKTYPRENKSSTDQDFYDPRKSSVDDDVIEEFIKAPLSREIQSVPGIAMGNARIFLDEGVVTPHQLIAVYLAMSGDTDDPVELSYRFYLWLQMIGINSNRNTIVEVVARKANSWVPGIYDGSLY